MKPWKQRIPALLAATALFLSLCGCGSQQETAAETGDLTDGAGRALSIPEAPEQEKIASAYGAVVPFLAALELGEQVVAVNAKSTFWMEAVPPLQEAGSVGRGVVDLEALAESGATVLVHRANDPETVDAVTQLGIDVVCISAEDTQGVYDTLELLGAYFGKEDRATEVVDWMERQYDAIEEITASIPQKEQVTAMVMGSEPGRVAGGDMLQSHMIEAAGGISVSAEMTNDSNWMDVGVETVFTWDPQYIFCTSSASLEYDPAELLEDPTWSALAAVQAEHILKIPAQIDSWDIPGVASVLGTWWMLHQMYPQYCDQDMLETAIADYYTFLFGRTFDADYLGYSL